MKSRPRVLVIDDDPLFRNLLLRFLRKDCIVFVASEGSEGYHKALEHPPTVAVIDIQMPGWDGLKTLRAFRSQQTLCKIPIMILTSDASRKTVVSAIEAGADSYIIKSGLSRDEFLEKLNRLCPGTITSDDSGGPCIAAARGIAEKLTHPATRNPTESNGGALASGDSATSDVGRFTEQGTRTSPAEIDDATASEAESRMQALMDNWE